MASFVMMLGIASSIITIQTGFKQMDLARGSTIAAQIIQSEMESIRLLSWTGVSALPASQKVDASTYFSSSASVTGYTVWRYVANDTTNPTDMKDITVTVSWNTYDGRSHSRTYTAIYAKNGLYDYYYTTAH